MVLNSAYEIYAVTVSGSTVYAVDSSGKLHIGPSYGSGTWSSVSLGKVARYNRNFLCDGSHVYILSTSANKVDKYTVAGAFVASYTTTNSYSNCAMDHDSSYIYLRDGDTLKKINKSSMGLVWSKSLGATSTIGRVQVHGSNSIFVVAGTNIFEFDSNGNEVRRVACQNGYDHKIKAKDIYIQNGSMLQGRSEYRTITS